MKFKMLYKTLFILILFSSYFGLGQDENSPIFNLKSLSQEQKNLIGEQRKKIKASREKFRGSLTSKQLEILKNSNLSKLDKRRALITTFTNNQKKMIRQTENRLKKLSFDIKSSLNNNQKKELKNLKFKNSKLKSGDTRGNKVKDKNFRNYPKRTSPNNKIKNTSPK